MTKIKNLRHRKPVLDHDGVRIFTFWTPSTALALQAQRNLFSEFLMRFRISIFCSELSRNSVELIHFKNASERARKGLGNGKVARPPTCKNEPRSEYA